MPLALLAQFREDTLAVALADDGALAMRAYWNATVLAYFVEAWELSRD
jgi:hypothetical protein